ncbi:MAG: hypothetical protein HYU64_19745, partial [Armatimonadetes bacterium]|nr:hypothetical protein [Armatimonadota bacterium]
MKTLTPCIAAVLLVLLTQWGYCAEATLNLRHLQDLEIRLETPGGKTFRVWAIYGEPDSAKGAEAPYRHVEA